MCLEDHLSHTICLHLRLTILLPESHASDREWLGLRSVAGGVLCASVGPYCPKWLVDEPVHLGAPRRPILQVITVRSGRKCIEASM